MFAYNIYIKNSTVKAVRQEKWSWSAFFFPYLWAIFHGLWLVLFGLTVVAVLICVGIELADGDPQMTVLLVAVVVATVFVNCFVAQQSTSLKQEALVRRGYALASEIHAKDAFDAAKKYELEHPEIAESRGESLSFKLGKVAARSTRECPYCAERIKIKARFCKHCHQHLS